MSFIAKYRPFLCFEMNRPAMDIAGYRWESVVVLDIQLLSRCKLDRGIKMSMI